MGKGNRNRAARKTSVIPADRALDIGRKMHDEAMARGPFSDEYFRVHGEKLVRKPDGSLMELRHGGQQVVGDNPPLFSKNGWLLYVGGEMQEMGAFGAPRLGAEPIGLLVYEKTLKEKAEQKKNALTVPMRDQMFWLYGIGPDNAAGYKIKMAFFHHVLGVNELESNHENMHTLEKALEFFATEWQVMLSSAHNDEIRDSVNNAMHAPSVGEIRDEGGNIENIPGVQ